MFKGRSEDLIRNLECATRVENSEDERRRSLLRTKIPHVDPNSVYITKSAGKVLDFNLPFKFLHNLPLICMSFNFFMVLV